jgi:hypothetical protein
VSEYQCYEFLAIDRPLDERCGESHLLLGGELGHVGQPYTAA